MKVWKVCKFCEFVTDSNADLVSHLCQSYAEDLAIENGADTITQALNHSSANSNHQVDVLDPQEVQQLVQVDHDQIPLNNESYMCESCGYKTSSLTNFKIHVDTMHRSIKVRVNQTQASDIKQDIRFECSLCDPCVYL